MKSYPPIGSFQTNCKPIALHLLPIIHLVISYSHLRRHGLLQIGTVTHFACSQMVHTVQLLLRLCLIQSSVATCRSGATSLVRPSLYSAYKRTGSFICLINKSPFLWACTLTSHSTRLITWHLQSLCSPVFRLFSRRVQCVCVCVCAC